MRVSAIWLCVTIGLLMTGAPAEATRPPRPLVASHGVKVKAGYIGQCPRRNWWSSPARTSTRTHWA